jgi:phosphohistidine phosphatase
VSLKLYFLRHGQAGDPQDWQGDDLERPLTDEGRRRMTCGAAAMRKLDLPLDAIISSPLLRAVQTAEIVANAQDAVSRLITDGRLRPGFDPTHLTAIMAEHRGARGLMLVGHEPDLSETISHLTGGARVRMKKGALACVEVEDPAVLKGTLVYLISPKVLESL